MKILIVLGSLLAVAVLAAGGWFGYWFLAGQSQTNQYIVNTQSQQYQASLIDQERNRAQGFDAAAPGPQQTQIASTFCAVLPSVTIVPADLTQASARMCNK